jgi:putative ABC transport system permease protein
MSLWESVRVAMEGLVANRLRSALTMLGVIFGVGAVIAAVAMTEGAKAATLEQFERFGTNVLTVRAGQMRRGPVRGGAGTQNTLTYRDALAIAKECPTVTAVVPEVSTSAQVKAGNANTNTRIYGETENYPEVRNFQIADGNFLTASDDRGRRKVAVLGPTTAENLFGPGQSAVGRRIKINSVTFQVIGQFESKGDTGFFSQDDLIVVPLSTAMFRLIGQAADGQGPRDRLRAISVQFAGMALAEQARTEVEALLRRRHGIGPDDEDDFNVRSAADMIEGAEEANRIMTLLFGSIAAVSLLVGGIGIMNIMLVSVTERTREIGLRKAVGATPRDILTQFLIEALTLSLVGGGIGVALGVGLAMLLRVVGLNTAVSVPWVAVAFSFAAAVGIVFGMLPSRKAAGLDPVEALRYE